MLSALGSNNPLLFVWNQKHGSIENYSLPCSVSDDVQQVVCCSVVKLSKYRKGLEGVFPFYYVRNIDYCVGCHAMANAIYITR